MRKKVLTVAIAVGIGYGLGSVSPLSTSANSNVVLASVEWVLSKINPLEQRIAALESQMNNNGGSTGGGGGTTVQTPVQDQSSVVTTKSVPVRKGASTNYEAFFTAPTNTVLTYYSTYTNSSNGEKWYIVRLSNGKLGAVPANSTSVSVNRITTGFTNVVITNNTPVRKGASSNYEVFYTATTNSVLPYHSTYTNSITGEKWYIVKLSNGKLGTVLAVHSEVIK